MKKTKRGISNTRSSVSVVLGLALMAIVLFLLKDHLVNNPKNAPAPTGGQTASKTTPPVAGTTTALPAVASQPESPPSPPVVEAAKQRPEASACQQTAGEIEAFIKGLEGKAYIKAYGLNEPLPDHLETIISQLLNNPPINANETSDLLTILKNNSHVFRVIGIKNLSLLKDILTNEHSSLEQLFSSLYSWSNMNQDCLGKSSLKLHLPLAKTYEYAAFFLNTLGGKSYLSRRDPTTRVMIRYYSVLIVNQAIKHSMNKYNIDLYYHLRAVMKDISDNSTLEDQEQYLDTLRKIQTGH